MLIKEEDSENRRMEVTGDELTEEEKETAELIKDLPVDKKVEEDEAEKSTRSTLLSDQVREQEGKEEKNKIRRI